MKKATLKLEIDVTCNDDVNLEVFSTELTKTIEGIINNNDLVLKNEISLNNNMVL